MPASGQTLAMNRNTDDPRGFTGGAWILFVAANLALIAGFAIELRHLVLLRGALQRDGSNSMR